MRLTGSRYMEPTTSPPAGLYVGAAIIFLVGGLGPNIGLAALSVALLMIAFHILWRPGEAPILLLVFTYPWFQASISTFQSNWIGQDVAAYALPGSDIVGAIILSLLGLLVLALGMRLGVGRPSPALVLQAQAVAMARPITSWAALYALSMIGSLIATSGAWIVPTLSQVMLAIAATKWLFFFMLAFSAFARRRATDPMFVAAFLWEFALGVGGYFSDFKTVFLVTLLAGLASGVRLSRGAVLGTATLSVAMVCVGIAWTAVKGEYRQFVSRGEATQEVLVDYNTRVSKLLDLVQSIDLTSFGNAADQMMRRLTYVEYFGVVLNTVPASLPHENGAILLDSIVRPFMPRFFFPNKTEIDDTARTNLYTHNMAGHSEATSISLGWIAEMYIDFGDIAMFVGILLIGYFYGRIYRWLASWKRTRGLFGIAAACSVLHSVAVLENSFTKVFGGVVVQLLVIWLLARYVVPRFCGWVIR
jgi:hypothetical protein